MNAKPLISVLTPTYNHEKYVESFIRSLLAQTYVNWELIIVDDCSTDNNISTIQKITDTRIHLFQQGFNQGPGAALNRAFSESQGDIIVDMASDDLLYPDYFEYIVNIFSLKPNIGVIYSSLDVINEKNEVYTHYQLPQNKNRIEFLRDLFYKNNVLFSPGFAIRRDLYASIIPMDVSMIQHQDYQWHVLFLGKSDCFVAEKNFVKYRYIPYNKKSLSSFNLGEFNRMRLEIDKLMDSFLEIKDMNLIKEITSSQLCEILPSSCYEYIWALEALKCKNYEKKQWGYKIISKVYNNDSLRKELNSKLGFNFSSYLNIGKINVFYAGNDFSMKKIKQILSKIYHLIK